MSGIKYNKEYIKYQISELESRHGDIDEINRYKKILTEIDQNQGMNINYEDKSKKFREQIKIQAQPKNDRKTNISKKSKTRKIKNKPNFSFKKAAFYGVIAGVSLGIPTYKAAYNYMINQPTPYNYITIEETKRGITDRKDHDNSKYKRYLIEHEGLTEEEANEQIRREEEEEKWGRE